VDGLFDISDSVLTIGFVFLGTVLARSCGDAANDVGDGPLDVSDVIRAVGFVLLGTEETSPQRTTPPLRQRNALRGAGDVNVEGRLSVSFGVCGQRFAKSWVRLP
jgi:hypothetical protein